MNLPTLVVEHVDASSAQSSVKSVKLHQRSSLKRVGGTPEGKYKYNNVTAFNATCLIRKATLPPIKGPISRTSPIKGSKLDVN
jgi:hypothetical protein